MGGWVEGRRGRWVKEWDRKGEEVEGRKKESKCTQHHYYIVSLTCNP